MYVKNFSFLLEMEIAEDCVNKCVVAVRSWCQQWRI